VTDDDDTRLAVGALARATGLTVRTLHHWDAIGLLTPSERSAAGHRRYGPGDVRRLYRVLALRRLGLPLDEVAAALAAEGGDLRLTVRRHLERVEAELAGARAVQRRLTALLASLERAEEPSVAELIRTIEEMAMYEQHYTPEQLETLRERADAFGPERLRGVEQEWAELYDALRAEQARGTDPGAPAVQALAARARELLGMFTGGDAGISASLERLHHEQGTEQATRGMADPQVQAYLGRAHAAAGVDAFGRPLS